VVPKQEDTIKGKTYCLNPWKIMFEGKQKTQGRKTGTDIKTEGKPQKRKRAVRNNTIFLKISLSPISQK